MEPIALPVVETLGRNTSLDKVAKPLKRAVDKVIPSGPVKDTLAGTWLGHPLHPVLTDIPIGAWASAWFLDVLGGREAESAADALIGIGVVSALPTAAAGFADWVDTWGATRRIGLVHIAGNTAALALFAASYAARKAGRRKIGFALSTIGMSVSSAAAYLGGHLTFGRGVGVDNTAFDEEPVRWIQALNVDELSDGKPIRASAGDVKVLLFRDGDEVHAIADTCTHRGCSLAEGDVKDGAVVCPCHGSTFRLADGRIVRGPATAPQTAYDARIVEGRVEVRVRHPRN